MKNYVIPARKEKENLSYPAVVQLYASLFPLLGGKSGEEKAAYTLLHALEEEATLLLPSLSVDSLSDEEKDGKGSEDLLSLSLSFYSRYGGRKENLSSLLEALRALLTLFEAESLTLS